MIDIIEDVVALIRAEPGFHNRVYRMWPRTKAVKPCCVVTRTSAVTTSTDHDGSELDVQLVYTIDIDADSIDEADSLASSAIDRMATINFHRSGDTNFYDASNAAYRRVVSFIGTVHRDGNIFTSR
jgi:hypothetical protein